jgi:hypothetical protein
METTVHGFDRRAEDAVVDARLDLSYVGAVEGPHMFAKPGGFGEAEEAGHLRVGGQSSTMLVAAGFMKPRFVVLDVIRRKDVGIFAADGRESGD